MKDLSKNLSSILFFLGVIYLSGLVTYVVIFQDKIFIAIVSVLGTLFVQRYLEGSRNEKEQQELARLIITLVNWRILIFFTLRNEVISSNNHSIESKKNIIMGYLKQIEKDEVYNSMLKNIGILPLNILRYFFEYDFTLKNLIDSLENDSSNDSGIKLSIPECQLNLSIQITFNIINGEVTMMLLSKQVLKDRQEFEIHKQFLVNEYWRLKDAKDLPSEIFESLIQIENVFQEIGISNELNVCPIPEK